MLLELVQLQQELLQQELLQQELLQYTQLMLFKLALPLKLVELVQFL